MIPAQTALTIQIERVNSLTDEDIANLCEAVDAAILGGNAAIWACPPSRDTLERYFRGVSLVSERNLFIARINDTIVGCAQLVRPSRTHQDHAMSCSIQYFFLAPYACGQGITEKMITEMEKTARQMGYMILNAEARATQTKFIHIIKEMGFEQWGTHPYYAKVEGKLIPGLFFTKKIHTTPHISEGMGTPLPDPSFQKSFFMPSSSLTLYPAIDLKDGQCVRLKQGEMNQATIYSDNPAEQARKWKEAGFEWLHIVDLNGAFAGHSVNQNAIREILAATSLPVQLGGGIRDMKAVEFWLNAGVRRVILGSAAVKNPQLVKDACQAYPGRVVVGIDARHGHVLTEGWAESSNMQVNDLALRMEEAGAAAIIFTEISRDGMLSGLDIQQTTTLANCLSIPVIASGGIGSIDHLHTLRKAANDAPGIEGVIVGRALYDGRVLPQQALEALR